MNIVYVPMAADLMHEGHFNIIKKANRLGNVYIGLLTDNAIMEYKKIPVLDYEQRKKVMENIKGVKKIIPQNTWDYLPNLEKLKPNFLVHGDDWKTGPQIKMRAKCIKLLKKWDGKLIEIPYTQGISTTILQRKLRSRLQWGAIQEEVIGKNELLKLNQYLEHHKYKEIFLVTGNKSYKKTGAKDIISKTLSKYNITIFDRFNNNPEYYDALKGAKLFNKAKSDIIICIGGGSVIDMGKLINAFQAHQGCEKKITIGEKYLENELCPLIAIPTTVGSGSESTHFAVIYLNNSKYSIASPKLLPTKFILDSELTANIPNQIKNISAFDGLSQAIESYWSIGSNSLSRDYSEEAIKIYINVLSKGRNYIKNNNCEDLLYAANLAGKAINITKTTAAHALSYGITIMTGLPHGHAVSLILGELFTINDKAISNYSHKYNKDYHKMILKIYSMFGVKSSVTAKKFWYKLMAENELKINLKDLGLHKKNNINTIVKNINLERLSNHPVKLDRLLLTQIFTNHSWK
ncbi:iron-containing alcohol dehydrogenase [bacterium]|nr:iron-containing alcohol dehydrogenase [bacterium]